MCFRVADTQCSKVTPERVAVLYLIMPVFIHIHVAFHFEQKVFTFSVWRDWKCCSIHFLSRTAFAEQPLGSIEQNRFISVTLEKRKYHKGVFLESVCYLCVGNTPKMRVSWLALLACTKVYTIFSIKALLF